MSRLNKGLISLAYQIIDGIPEKSIRLAAFISKKAGKDGRDCGTIACGFGWIALHPLFNLLGLVLNEAGQPEIEGQNMACAADVAAYIFGGASAEAYCKMFTVRHGGTFDDRIFDECGRGISDKELLLRRLKRAYYE